MCEYATTRLGVIQENKEKKHQLHCNRDLPLISIFHPKKIKGFRSLIKKSTIAEKIKSCTLDNAILRLRTLKKLRVFPPNAP